MNTLLTLFKLSHYSDFDDSNKTISKQLLQNLDILQHATIQEASEFCYVSVPTLRRFMKNIGFDSFSRFKEALRQEASRFRFSDHADAGITTSLEEALEAYVDQAVRLLHRFRNSLEPERFSALAKGLSECKRIFIFSCYLPATLPYFCLDLCLWGKEVEVCETRTDQNMYLNDLSSGDYLLVLDGKMQEMEDIPPLVKQAYTQGARIGLISSDPQSNLLHYAADSYTFHGSGKATDTSNMDHCINLLAIACRAHQTNAIR